MKDKKALNIEIGIRIKQEREKAGLTQERFSELIGLGPKSVSAVECGAVGVSLSTLQRICRVLSVSSDALLFGAQAQNDAIDLVARLERLSPAQFQIASDLLNKLLEAFALGKRP